MPKMLNLIDCKNEKCQKMLGVREWQKDKRNNYL